MPVIALRNRYEMNRKLSEYLQRFSAFKAAFCLTLIFFIFCLTLQS